MRFTLSDDQQEIKRTAHDLLASRSGVERVRENAEAGRYDDALWKELGELGWPGIASLPVIRTGWAGVDMFFVLSGFILMLVHERDFQGFDLPPLLRFAWLRFFRVYPLATVVLLMLLALVVAGVVALHEGTGVAVTGAVMTVVPLVAMAWILILPPLPGGRAATLAARIGQFATRDLAGYRGEIILLFMAGFIGSLGSWLLVPIMQAHGPDLSTAPPLLILAALVWTIPLTGQIGMNPILAVSLLACRSRRGGCYWLTSASFGAVVPTLAAWLIGPGAKVPPSGAAWLDLLLTFVLNCMWGLGTALILLL